MATYKTDTPIRLEKKTVSGYTSNNLLAIASAHAMLHRQPEILPVIEDLLYNHSKILLEFSLLCGCHRMLL